MTLDSRIDKKVINGCKTCRTIQYTMPHPISRNIADFLLPFGKQTHNLDVYSTVKIDNDELTVSSRLGSVELTARFKNKDDQRIVDLFEVQLSAYLQAESKVPVSGANNE